MSHLSRIALLSLVCISILSGCGQKLETSNQINSNSISEQSSAGNNNPDPGTSREKQPEQTGIVIKNSLSERDKAIQKQYALQVAADKKMRDDLMRSSKECSDITMADDLKQYLSSPMISAEQKKHIETDFSLSGERCKIRAAIREKTDCATLGDLRTKCEVAKSAAQFIRQYESNKAVYKEYFGDPAVVYPEEVFKNEK